MVFRRNLGLARRSVRVGPMNERTVSFIVWSTVIAAVVLVAVMAGRARGQELPAYPCPIAGKPCKIVVMTPEEEKTLTDPDMLMDHAIWANRVKFDSLVAAWRQKLQQAPAGKIVEPKPEDKK